MRRLIELTLVLAIAVGGLLSATTPTAQAAPVECEKYDPFTGRCIIFIPPPPPDYPAPPGEGPGDPGEPADPMCADWVMGTEVPCIVGDWYWSYEWACYARLELAPDPNDPAWGGETDGALYWCARGVTLSDPFPPDAVLRWAPLPPWGAPPDPEEIAQTAIETMNLRAIEIGIVPEQGADRVGLLGLPTWMWVDDVSGSTWGPITRTATSGPWSVTATAEVDRIEWDMGDGTVVACRTPGTEYQDSYLDADSPDCGHRYTEPGRYAVSATSFWVINWSGLGQSGTIEMDFTQNGQIVMGEVQVLNQQP